MPALPDLRLQRLVPPTSDAHHRDRTERDSAMGWEPSVRALPHLRLQRLRLAAIDAHHCNRCTRDFARRAEP